MPLLRALEQSSGAEKHVASYLESQVFYDTVFVRVLMREHLHSDAEAVHAEVEVVALGAFDSRRGRHVAGTIAAAEPAAALRAAPLRRPERDAQAA
eukprot:COSAG02_NODE_36325_length_456_cov_0.717087_1_plen_95_part_10